MRYIDDCVVGFQYQTDAQRFEQGLGKRLAKFALALEPTNTRLAACGRFAERAVKRQGKRQATCTFLGRTLYGTRNRRGKCKVGWRTDKARLRRSLATFHPLLQSMRHEPRKEQAEPSNQRLRGHYASYGIAGHGGSLLGGYRHGERAWRARLSSRSQKGYGRWEAFLALTRKYPRQRPKLSLPYARLKPYAVLCIIG